jgi:hypothetical protein
MRTALLPCLAKATQGTGRMNSFLILSLLLPMSLMAMEDQNPPAQTNEPLYVGIGTHLISEGTYQGKTVIFACEEDWIIYEEDKEKNTFDYVDRITHNYVTRDEPGVIKTLPKELSSLEHNISNVSFTKSDKQCANVTANIKITTLPVAGLGYIESLWSTPLAIGYASYLPIAALTGATLTQVTKTEPYTFPVCLKKLSDSQYFYAPGSTRKLLEHINPTTKKLKLEPITINEPKLSQNQITSLLKNPEPHPLSIVMAFLRLQKQNGAYIPVPEKNSLIVPDEQFFTINITQDPI